MAFTRVAKPGLWNSGDLISATDLNSLPGGTIGRDTLVGDSTGITSLATVCSCSPSVGPSREITATFGGNTRGSSQTGAFGAIFEDSVQLNRRSFEIRTSDSDMPFHLSILSYPSTGTHVYEGVVGVSGGGGATVTCSNNGYTGARGVTQLRVVDTAPQF